MARREERYDGQATWPLLVGVGQVIHGVLVILLVRAVAVIETLFIVFFVLFFFFVVVGLCEIGGGMHASRELARRTLRWWRRAVGLLEDGTTLSAVAGGEHGAVPSWSVPGNLPTRVGAP